MAITRSQQAKQMLRNGGMSLQEAKDMAPKGEFLAYINNKEANMLKKAGGSGIMTKAGIPSFVEYGGRDAFEGAKSTGSVQGDVDRGRGDGPNPVDEVALVTGPKTKTKTKDKDNILDIFNPLSKKRKKFAYNLSMLTPGQIERSKKMQTAYKNYLESMGVSIPSTLTGEEEDLAEFFVESAFNKPVPEDAMLETPQSYGEFIAENFGAPGVMMSGNVGGLEKFVKTRNPDGSPATFGYRNVSDRGDPNILLPQGIMAQAPSITDQGTTTDTDDDTDGRFLRFRAEGGPIGGEYDFESARQMYGLGKLVKKVGRTVKKIAKSPIGKAALLYAGGTFLGGLKFAGGAGLGSGTFLSNLRSGQGIANLGGFLKGKLLSSATTKPGTSSGGLLNLIKDNPMASIFGASALAGLLTAQQEEEAQELARGEGIDIEAARRSILNAGTSQDFRARRFVAEGGSMKEPVAKKTMPLLDMGGQEMDLRAEGGFVPIGRMEKADDVPARLSKNEFVFTADAVRNAGDGDVDKGAEVMYNMMKNLEAGGDVSEESQGLEGARKMFQTSQRLEEVL